MKFIRVIKARWNDNDKFTSFQEALAYDLKNNGVVYEDLFWLSAHLWDLEEIIDGIRNYDFLNSRIKKILEGITYVDYIQLEFEELLNDNFYYVYEDLDLSGAQSNELPQNLEQLKTRLNDLNSRISKDLKDLKKSITNISDYGSRVFKTRVINNIDKFEKYILNISNKYIDYLNKEYNK